MKETKKYWKGLEELNNDSDFIQNRDDEFPSLSLTEGSDSSENEGDTSRRDFLKMMGFSVAAASLVACEAPVRKVIPYINKPEEVDPGKPNYYASSYVDGSNYCSVVVKTREGRPVHLEGNTESAISQGGVDARVSASVLDLYDSSRLKTFTKAGSEIAVTDADKEISAALSSASNIRLVSQSVLSPSVQAAINEFLAAYPGAKQVKYDAVSASGLLNANGGVIPSYDFSKANIIAGFNADFLGTWISPVEFSKQYSSTRRLQKGKNAKQDISRHYQFETTLSVTGSSADYRQPIKASEEGAYLTALYNLVAAKVGATTFKANKIENATLTQLASDLLANKGKSLVVSGSNDDNVQLVVKEINALLGNEGSTLDLASPSYLKQGNDKAFNAFVKEMNAGKVDAVIFFNANPVYDTPAGASVTAGLAKVKTKISFADRADETASLVDYVCPDTHYLESWGDANPKKGSYSLIQPAISPLFKGNREAAESLLIWAGNKTPFYQYVRNYWEKALFPTQTSELLFDTYWDKVLQKGVYQTSTVATIVEETVSDSLTTQQEEIVELEETEEIEVSENSLSQSVISKITKAESGTEISVYESVKLGAGKSANNPWLQELPDPISKVTWDNYLAVSILDISAETSNVKELVGLKDGDVVTVTAGSTSVVLPILVQPGQASGTVSAALGYGRAAAGKLQNGIMYKNAAGETKIGANVVSFIQVGSTSNKYFTSGVTIASAGKTHKIARTQTHQTIMGRHNVQEAILSDYKKDATVANVNAKYSISTSEGKLPASKVDAWVVPTRDEEGNIEEGITHKYQNHHWGLAIDLNTCTGCSACVVSCHAENNVPVVGKDEVLRRRDMHWMRIDRYYSSQAELDHGKEGAKDKAGYQAMEVPAANPEVVFQPMMCQHCNHAPCETVCPVLATTHSSEGLNQMTYNRCIGTRYCANNCPYKVRRFNWFNYSDSKSDREFKAVNTPANDDLGKMVLNPDVTVRARGVMEKCSMCVQRIQAGKLEAKMESRKVEDGEINTACASVCPTDAIVFGDMNNQESKIYKVLNEENSERAYHVLEEINVKPNVSYLTKIRNKA